MWHSCVTRLREEPFALILNRRYCLFVSIARHFVFKTFHVSIISLVVSSARNFISDQKSVACSMLLFVRAGFRERNDVKTGASTYKGVLTRVHKFEVFAIM